MIFSVLDNLLNEKINEKIKNPSFLPVTNSVSIKVSYIDNNKEDIIKKRFKEETGLTLQIDK